MENSPIPALCASGLHVKVIWEAIRLGYLGLNEVNFALFVTNDRFFLFMMNKAGLKSRVEFSNAFPQSQRCSAHVYIYLSRDCYILRMGLNVGGKNAVIDILDIALRVVTYFKD